MIGKILGNRYEILEKIGGGGMALVYKARCNLLDRFVAIKILRQEFNEDEEFIRKFRRESQAAASLSHPNIVNIYDVGVEKIDDHDVHYIVMEYIKGKTLKKVIQEKSKLSMEDTIYYSLQIGEALENAHRNHIVHRDIKPHNIMITEDNRVKVTDFGIARAATSSTVTVTSNVLGSVHYFSPEQARGGYTDEKSDIYSLGIVMYEMLTGKLPFSGDSPITVALKHVQEDLIPPREIDNNIPISMENIILKCTQKRQADRYASISDLIKDLRTLKNSDNYEVGIIDNMESATRIIPTVQGESEKDMGRRKKKDNINKSNKPKGEGKVIFAGIFLAFLLATLGFMGWMKMKGLIANTDEIIVPKIIGMEESLARKTIEDLDLEFVVKARVKNNEFKPGEVITQSEDEGAKVKKGFPIEVTISEGEDLSTVPNLINKSIEEAEALLTRAGLIRGGISYDSSDDIPPNMIMDQNPKEYTQLEPGSRVDIIVSKGEEVKTVVMTKLVGMELLAAKNEILRLGLEIGDTKEEPSDNVEAGLIIWQSYEQGTELELGTTVDIYVSSGPDKEPIEENGENNNENKEESFTINLMPFANKEVTEIKIYRRQDGVTETVHNKKHKADKGEVSIELKGKRGSEFDIYYDDIYQGTIPKD